jgi:hypothetical protein
MRNVRRRYKMRNTRFCGRIVHSAFGFSGLVGILRKHTLTVSALLIFAGSCMAQTQPAAPSNAEPPADAKSSTLTIPAGASFALVLTNPVSSKTTRRGDEIHAQTTAPVTVGDQVLIPAGTYVQGKLDKLTRVGDHAAIVMKSASVVFPGGYVANIVGPISVESGEETAWRNPSDQARVGAFLAPMIGGGLGALIGSQIHTTQSSSLGGTTITTSTPKGIAIGSLVGVGAGVGISLAILVHSHGFFVDVGSPMEMTLPQPMTLSSKQVAESVKWAQEHPSEVPMAAPRPIPYARYDRGLCFTPGTPGTPPTFVPGTPAVGDSPGTPGTFIPGTPGTPGTSYPCP